MRSIIGISKHELLNLQPWEVDWPLSGKELLYLFQALDGFWFYDYKAGESGKPGYHALLKSGKHSDGFFYSKIVLQHSNLRAIIAKTLAQRFVWKLMNGANSLWNATCVAGIPEGARELGRDVARYLNLPAVEMEKIGGKIALISMISSADKLLLVEDFCTAGTGFKEAVANIWQQEPNVQIAPIELVILNRGGLKKIVTEDNYYFDIEAAVTHRVRDWDPETEECVLCKLGSIPIKPKATEENWRLITTAQN